MSWQDWLVLLGFLLAVVEFLFIYGIYRDDHAMLKIAERSLGISEETLAATKDYLALRRRWYAQREAKKERQKETVKDGDAENKGPAVGTGPTGQLPA